MSKQIKPVKGQILTSINLPDVWGKVLDNPRKAPRRDVYFFNVEIVKGSDNPAWLAGRYFRTVSTYWRECYPPKTHEAYGPSLEGTTDAARKFREET